MSGTMFYWEPASKFGARAFLSIMVAAGWQFHFCGTCEVEGWDLTIPGWLGFHQLYLDNVMAVTEFLVWWCRVRSLVDPGSVEFVAIAGLVFGLQSARLRHWVGRLVSGQLAIAESAWCGRILALAALLFDEPSYRHAVLAVYYEHAPKIDAAAESADHYATARALTAFVRDIAVEYGRSWRRRGEAVLRRLWHGHG